MKKNACGVTISEIGIPELSKKHTYFYQIQGQIAITQRKWHDLLIYMEPRTSYSSKNSWGCTILANLELKLDCFYVDCIVPEIIDSRKSRNMSLREPDFVSQAILKMKEKESKTKISEVKNRHAPQ